MAYYNVKGFLCEKFISSALPSICAVHYEHSVGRSMFGGWFVYVHN
jgi:hypothetical protein